MYNYLYWCHGWKHKRQCQNFLKDLANYLRIANSGEEVVITVDGKPFAVWVH